MQPRSYSPQLQTDGQVGSLPHLAMFRVKICGITSIDDALQAAEAGADAIGLNFYEPSPRFVAPDLAGEIVAALRDRYDAQRLAIFGVFVNATLDDIVWIFREGNLFGPRQSLGVQLHGDEPPELLAELRQHGIGTSEDLLHTLGYAPLTPVLRAFRSQSPDLADVKAYLQACQDLIASPQAILLDAHEPGTYGGTGKAVDWNLLARERGGFGGLPVILAGGLTPQNVAQAIAIARPHGVDVASGVESSPGKKDHAKVWSFVAAAKKAFAAFDP
jgi:phosphoribosylanthranilate isomerase